MICLLFALFVPQITAADNINTNPSIVEPSQLLQLPDSRILAVSVFLDKYKCDTQIQDFSTATEFVDDADTNGIDWRILPIIWIKESSCGKHQLVGDGFGWLHNGKLIPFASLTEAISTISYKLTQSPYKGKTLSRLVSTYCPTPDYLPSFMGFYAQITSSEQSYQKLMPEIANNQLQ